LVIAIFIVTLLVLLVNLTVVESSHLEALFVFSLFTILILDTAFDEIIQGEHVPSVVCLRLNLTFSSSLNRGLSEVDRIRLIEL